MAPDLGEEERAALRALGVSQLIRGAKRGKR